MSPAQRWTVTKLIINCNVTAGESDKDRNTETADRRRSLESDLLHTSGNYSIRNRPTVPLFHLHFSSDPADARIDSRIR